MNHKKHIVPSTITAKDSLERINQLNLDKVLFIVDEQKKLIGSLTDGDLRRGLLSNLTINDLALQFAQKRPAFINASNFSVSTIASLRKKFEIIPIVDDKMNIIDIINFRNQSSCLPVDAVVMAGGLGSRLKPLTDKIPKPLLKVGNKSSIQHNIDRLSKFGIKDYFICLNHMKEKIENHLNEIYIEKQDYDFRMTYVYEKFAMGTIGATTLVEDFNNDIILLTNSDVITKLDYEQFFLDFEEKKADLSMITIPYLVNIPYGVISIETSDNSIVSLDEKPNYTHYCNAGIYLFKKSLISEIPKNKSYNATDFVKKLIDNKYKVISYPIYDYWMDIGSLEEYEQANKDIKNLGF
tara:strand:+ start:6573 stop:7631 length:1059 start_codon:yes stop_codon:yes gene_type:complete